jgi:2-succinyl-6-hydroxy-2,4-cyclohexadiene-1-carboxylate synthase
VYLALTWPELFASVVLESTSAGLLEETGRDARLRADGKVARDLLMLPLDEFLDAWYRQPLFASMTEEQRSVVIAMRLKNDPGELAQSLVGLSVAAQPTFWDRLGELDVPVTCISGEHDEKYSGLCSKMADLCKHGRAVNVPGAGHNVHAEQPQAYFESLVMHLEARPDR